MSGRPVVLNVEFLLARILYTWSLPKEVAAKWSREGVGVGRESNCVGLCVCVRTYVCGSHACAGVTVLCESVCVCVYVCVCERDRDRDREICS